MRQFTTEIAVRSYELDSFGHVNHAIYLNYFEQARFDALESGGFPLREIYARGWGVHVVGVEGSEDGLKESKIVIGNDRVGKTKTLESLEKYLEVVASATDLTDEARSDIKILIGDDFKERILKEVRESEEKTKDMAESKKGSFNPEPEDDKKKDRDSLFKMFE